MFKTNWKKFVAIAVLAVALILIAARFTEICDTITKSFQL
jgi:hypothetical protein